MSNIINLYTSNTFLTINTITSILSLLGIAYLLKSINNRNQKLITHAMIALIGLGDLIFTISNFLTPWEHGPTCNLHGILNYGGVIMSIFWCVMLSRVTYKMSCHNVDQPGKSFMIMLLASFVVAGCQALLPVYNFLGSSYTLNQDSLCVIRAVQENDMLIDAPAEQLLVGGYFYYIPFLILFTITITYYILQYRNLKKMDPLLILAYKIDAAKLFWYPFGMFFAFMPSLIDGIVSYYNSSPVLGFAYAHMLIGHSLGFINCLIYKVSQRDESEQKRKLTKITSDDLEMVDSRRHALQESLTIASSHNSEQNDYLKLSSNN